MIAMLSSLISHVSRLQFYSDDEYKKVNNAFKYLSYLGIPLTLITLVVWLIDPKLRDQHLILMIGLFYLILSIVNSVYASKPLSASCSNNAVPIDDKDSITGLCASTSMINVTFIPASLAAWTIYFIDLALKVFGWNTSKYRFVHVIVVILAVIFESVSWSSLRLWG